MPVQPELNSDLPPRITPDMKIISSMPRYQAVSA